MKVEELSKAVLTGKEKVLVKRLRDVKVTNDGITFDGEKDPVVMDEITTNKISSYLKVPSKYMHQCPPELQQANLNHWLKQWPEAEAMFHVIDGHLQSIHRADRMILPMKDVVPLLEKTFDADDEIKRLVSEPERFEIDVMDVSSKVEVKGGHHETRPKVGDLTHGGLRFYAYPLQEKAPWLETYLHRLWCENGATIAEPDHQVTLKGSTVPEVLADLESQAQHLMGQMEMRLEQYRATADVKVEGDIAQFVLQLGKERRLGDRVTNLAVERVAELPNPVTAYDVTQLFTSIANESVTNRNRIRLQRLGGDLSSRTAEMLHRCNSCERPI